MSDIKNYSAFLPAIFVESTISSASSFSTNDDDDNDDESSSRSSNNNNNNNKNTSYEGKTAFLLLSKLVPLVQTLILHTILIPSYKIMHLVMP
jgi:hypothetical protein